MPRTFLEHLLTVWFHRPSSRPGGSPPISVQVPWSPKDHYLQELGLHSPPPRRVPGPQGCWPCQGRWCLRSVPQQPRFSGTEHAPFPRCFLRLKGFLGSHVLRMASDWHMSNKDLIEWSILANRVTTFIAGIPVRRVVLYNVFLF